MCVGGLSSINGRATFLASARSIAFTVIHSIRLRRSGANPWETSSSFHQNLMDFGLNLEPRESLHFAGSYKKIIRNILMARHTYRSFDYGQGGSKARNTDKR